MPDDERSGPHFELTDAGEGKSVSPLDDSKTGTIARVRLRNYKSIASCSVNLRPRTILVGPNGAGKSNVLDGLRFTADSLRYSLDHAM